MGVELWLDHHFLLQVVKVHDDFIVKVELLTTLSIDELSLYEIVKQEHEGTVVPHLILQDRIGLYVDCKGHLAEL